MATPLLRFIDLKSRNIVRNRVTLKRWIAEEQFPPGRLLGPNTRAWTAAEIEDWIASRPVVTPNRQPLPLVRKKIETSCDTTQYREVSLEHRSGKPRAGAQPSPKPKV